MNAQHDKNHNPHTLRGRARRRILSGTAALPSLVTLGNGIVGFASIHFATRPLSADASANLMSIDIIIAAWLILVGMVFDALDGQLARLTRKTSEFGAQLDSLCDAITFGVAPAILMLRAVQGELVPYAGQIGADPRAAVLGRIVWFIAALYAACAILRLARFNVETKPDLLSHLSFRGMPSPAAALVVVSLVLVHEHLKNPRLSDWRASEWLTLAVMWALPAVTLAAALLMVSRIRYPHLINRQLRGRKTFAHIVWLMVLGLFIVVVGLKDMQIVLAAAALSYLIWPPAAAAVMIVRNRAGKKPPLNA